MRIALLGGAFNPPHIGHILIAQQVLDFTPTDEVWFLPSYGQHPPKPDVASVNDRLAMAQMLKLPKTRVSTLEIDHKLDGNTIKLIPFLPKENSYTFVMGADWLPTFTVWGSWELLLEKMPFWVFPRCGHPNAPLYKNMTIVAHEHLIATDLSATKIRRRVKAGLPIEPFVSEGVAEYIREHGLYK